MEEIIHYRQARKSDFFGSVDVEAMILKGIKPIVTIDKMEYKENLMVNGNKKDKALVCTFTDKTLKQWIVNTTNAKTIHNLTGHANCVLWKGTTIELFIDEKVTMKGTVVGGLRVRPYIVKNETKPLFTEDKFQSAKDKQATIEFISQHYSLTEEIKLKYEQFCNS